MKLIIVITKLICFIWLISQYYNKIKSVLIIKYLVFNFLQIFLGLFEIYFLLIYSK